MLLGLAPASPRQQRDHEACGGAAEHAASRCKQSVDITLALGEGRGRRKPVHLNLHVKVVKVGTSTRARESALTNAVRQPPVEERLIGRSAAIIYLTKHRIAGRSGA